MHPALVLLGLAAVGMWMVWLAAKRDYLQREGDSDLAELVNTHISSPLERDLAKAPVRPHSTGSSQRAA